MESFFLLLKGYLTIKVSRYGFSRFINYCLLNHFKIWKITESEHDIKLNITLHDFKQLQDSVRKSKVSVHILERHGLPFCLYHLRPNVLFVFGIILCLSFLYYQKTHIWTVEIEGNTQITDEQIYDCLDSFGLYAGYSRRILSSPELENYLREQFDVFSWTSVSVEGTCLNISVIEKTTSSSTGISADYPSSLYATSDGIVHRLMVTRGYAVKSVGDEVKRGDLLISGEIPFLKDDGTQAYSLTAAEGDYLCEITIPYFNQVEIVQDCKNFEEFNTTSGSFLFNRSSLALPFHNTGKESRIILRDYKDLNFLALFRCNVYYIKESVCEYNMIQNKLTAEERHDILENHLTNDLRKLDENGAIEIKTVLDITETKTHTVMHGEIRYLSAAYIRQPIEPRKEGGTEHGPYTTDNGINN